MKNSYSLWIFILITSNFTRAQSISVDSLWNVLATAKSDTNKVNTLNLLSKEAGWKTKNFDTAFFYAEKAKKLAEQINFQKGIANAINNFGLTFEKKREYDQALQNFNAALEIRKKINSKSDIAASLNSIGNVYNALGDFDVALEKYHSSLKYFKEAVDKKGIALLLNNIGMIHEAKGNYSEALKYHYESIKIREEIDDKAGIAASLSNIGIIYKNMGNYPEALKHHLSALKIREVVGDKAKIAASFTNIGIVYYRQYNYAEALKYHQSALKIQQELDNKDGIATALSNIGNVYENLGDYNKALKSLEAALKLDEEAGEKKNIASSKLNIGVIYKKLGNHTEALKFYFSALELFEETGYQSGWASALSNIGAVFILQNKASEGKKWLLKSLNISKEMRENASIRDAYFHLSNADSALGNYKSAYEDHKLFIIYRDSLINEEQTKKTVQLEMQYEFDKKEAIFQAERTKEQELAKAELEKKSLERNASIGGLGLMMLLTIVFFTQRNRIRKEKDKSENLLLNILPFETAQELKAKGSADAKLIEEVTVLFTDFKGFTSMADGMTPKELVADLNVCFSEFDRIMEKYGIEKIKTIGDSYMAAGGLPTPNDTHALDVVKAAFEIRDFIEEGKQRKITAGLPYFEIRIGIHTGPVVAGIVGVKKFAYDIWGDTVNTANRMESSGEIGKVNISETTYQLVKDKYNCEYRGEEEAKGKGLVKMYFVESKI